MSRALSSPNLQEQMTLRVSRLAAHVKESEGEKFSLLGIQTNVSICKILVVEDLDVCNVSIFYTFWGGARSHSTRQLHHPE